jgi:hypothetical protein
MKGNFVKQALFNLIGGMVLVCMLLSPAYAVPKTLSYQGYLTDPAGNAINKTVIMIFQPLQHSDRCDNASVDGNPHSRFRDQRRFQRCFR